MAFLGLKKNTNSKTKVSTTKSTAVAKIQSERKTNTHDPKVLSVLGIPRITEKGASLSENFNIYTFEVAPHSTKKIVAKAVAEIYKVHPVKVNILPVPSKKIFSRGKYGRKSGGKKAYVFLKKGEKIEFV